MDITGEHRITAPREKVWAALFDVETLKACIPGCKELEQTSPTSFAAKVQLKVGPVSATFAGTVELQDIDAPNGCRIVGQGNGGIAGFAKGGSQVTLVEDDGGTVLSYDAKAEIGGKLAALGTRLVQATSRKLADQFFTVFTARLTK
ncbi:carbon monoxide dehydrogenase subunit G [Bosea sp. (in: a-proteobacteria)]|uniref:SRPBCC family protein n=1 Tax=Bosea sp. (in: a-proteobacteria) TaxID=1871050 RepID=UPI00261212D4|nr:carbon monoxide dehydrogenase subunit G [Bosea sp. (in: a-proteobacteria)]MCO5092891.1 carbon monoxide dehydrogenase subunit G [Bosea sp. (in: a-proteobacteria)]